MNILIPNRDSGERVGELPQANLVWHALSVADQASYLKQFAQPNSGLKLIFDAEEAKRLRNEGRFNSIGIGNFVDDLLGATAITHVDKNGEVMANIYARFDNRTQPSIPDGTRVGTVRPQQITSILEKVLTRA